jgi:hypothetical protein
MNDDMAGRIMAHAFHDELEKIAAKSMFLGSSYKPTIKMPSVKQTRKARVKAREPRPAYDPHEVGPDEPKDLRAHRESRGVKKARGWKGLPTGPGRFLEKQRIKRSPKSDPYEQISLEEW